MTHDRRVLNETIKKLVDIEGLLLERAASELLDAITPIIVAAEREACVRDVEKVIGEAYQVRLNRQGPRGFNAFMEAGEAAISAIRARKP